MLPCVCSVIDQRWRQQIRSTRGDSQVYHWCSNHILTSSVIYYWTDARQHGIHLFYTITKQATTDKGFFSNFKIFQHNSKVGSYPFSWTRKKPFGVIYCLDKKKTHWLLCIAKNNLTGSGTLRHCQPWLERGLSWKKVTGKQNWIEMLNLQILKENAGKVKSVFATRADLGVKKLGCWFVYCRS